MFERNQIVYRPDHIFEDTIDPMRVIESRPRYTDCIYCESGVHVSHPTDSLSADWGEDEGPTCPSCDGTISESAITCPCGAVVKPDLFWVDPMPGASFEERMEFEAILEAEER